MESCLKPQHTLHVSLSSLNNTITKLISLISSCFHIPIDYFLTKLPIALLMHKIPSQSSVPKLLMPSHYTLNKIQSHYQHPHGPEYLICACLKRSLSKALPLSHFLPQLYQTSLTLQIRPVCSCWSENQNVTSLLSAIYYLVSAYIGKTLPELSC